MEAHDAGMRAKMMQQLAGPPGVFRSNDRDLGEDLFGPLAQITEVANRSGDDEEIARGHVWSLVGLAAGRKLWPGGGA